MKKSIFALLSVFALVFLLAACGSQGNNRKPTQSAETQAADQTTAVSDSEVKHDSESKTLVVYFSGSGNTKRVAEIIADETKSELFEITPSEPYTEDDLNWRDENSRVNLEHNDPSLQDIELTSVKVPDWENYDTVYFGYPLWWREAAWPVNNFVKNNDFSGKTVIPFCTSTSDGIGESGSKLAAMAGTGAWTDGKRFSESEDESAVREWARG